ncbi:hypothetical protein TrLO_g1895 [Triparma laevis f. longispina]|uniref:Uncharacterized protein n=1 Tax=Triparma laevis f. longispina TaxID=1714387 RepID=A0A9W7FJB5_9STRA|nr:hypothetical protein TrLO_g1895 [Triparma laevis f. longispina]
MSDSPSPSTQPSDPNTPPPAPTNNSQSPSPAPPSPPLPSPSTPLLIPPQHSLIFQPDQPPPTLTALHCRNLVPPDSNFTFTLTVTPASKFPKPQTFPSRESSACPSFHTLSDSLPLTPNLLFQIHHPTSDTPLTSLTLIESDLAYLGNSLKLIESFPINCLVLQLHDGRIYGSNESFLNNEFGTPPETVEIEEHHAHYVPPTILPEVKGNKGAMLGEKDERKEMMEVYCRLKREGREGKRRLQIEERALREEEEEITSLTSEINEAISAVQLVSQQTEKVTNLLSHRQNLLKSTTFLLQTRQITLLTSLRTFFPIRKISVSTWTIRGLNITKPYEETEEAGSAWGIVVHLLTMISKYLDLPMRYKLLSNSSRSAVQDGNRIWPLFGRGLTEGIRALEMCVEGVLRGRDIESKEGHVLGKVEELFVRCEAREERCDELGMRYSSE